MFRTFNSNFFCAKQFENGALYFDNIRSVFHKYNEYKDDKERLVNHIKRIMLL